MKNGKFFDGTFEELSENPQLKKIKKRKLYKIEN